jgi:hypothetical protein
MTNSPFTVALCGAIRAKVKSNRRDGITSMSVDNLKQIVRPPSASLEGAPRGTNVQYAYSEMFRECCRSVGIR